MSEPAGGRGRHGRHYTLITPGNHYASRLPSLIGATVVKLVTPRLSPARFGQYLVITVGAEVPDCPLETSYEHFLFGLDGEAWVGSSDHDYDIKPRGFAYIPASSSFTLRLGPDVRLLWLKRPYEPVPRVAGPASCGGHASMIEASATPTRGLTRRELLAPDEPSYDFNMSLMRFEPGVGLPQIEIHDEEHGLWMTEGGGVYHLDDEDHDVEAGDFIYMAPYCPQGFRSGTKGAEYLLYKDVYRDGF